MLLPSTNPWGPANCDRLDCVPCGQGDETRLDCINLLYENKCELCNKTDSKEKAGKFLKDGKGKYVGGKHLDPYMKGPGNMRLTDRRQERTDSK